MLSTEKSRACRASAEDPHIVWVLCRLRLRKGERCRYPLCPSQSLVRDEGQSRLKGAIKRNSQWTCSLGFIEVSDATFSMALPVRFRLRIFSQQEGMSRSHLWLKHSRCAVCSLCFYIAILFSHGHCYRRGDHCASHHARYCFWRRQHDR